MAKEKVKSPTTIRLPDALRKRVEAEATEDHRSFTSQIIHIISKHYEEKDAQ